MKNILLTLLLHLLTLTLFGQSEKATYKTVADSFEKNYNTEKYEDIFKAFSTEMQRFFPLNEVKTYFSSYKSESGKITKRAFNRYDQTYAVYKTDFERGSFAINISVNKNSKIDGFSIAPFKESNLPKIARNTTKLQLPFEGECTVIWGGDTKELNYHIESEAQKNTFDIVIMDANGKSYKTDGKTNKDYYDFRKELLAPCDGEVILVVDGVKENKPGILNPILCLEII